MEWHGMACACDPRENQLLRVAIAPLLSPCCRCLVREAWHSGFNQGPRLVSSSTLVDGFNPSEKY